MFLNNKISDGIFHICVNDRRKTLFENLWPLPNGVAYNCFLINDDKTVLVDTVESGSDLDFIHKIEQSLGGKELDYLVVNHMEPDHSGSIKDVVRQWPNVQIIGNKQTTKILNGYFGELPNIMEIKDGEELNLGTHNLKFILTPWLHWPETMMTYETTTGTLFSGDAFGSFGTLDGGVFDDEVKIEYYLEEMRRYYTNIVAKYSTMVQKALTKLNTTSIHCICPVHGIIWRENPCQVLSLYDKWSSHTSDEAVIVIYASMYGHTESMADHIARSISLQGVKDIRVYDVSKTHVSYLISEVWRCKGIVLGSCAYNTEMHPNMEHLCTELTHYGAKNKKLALFGSYSWNGGGVRNLSKFAETIKWEQVCEPIDLLGRPTLEKLADVETMAVAIAKAIKE